jgi:uncharacterized protein YeeX (DUF496 family)
MSGEPQKQVDVEFYAISRAIESCIKEEPLGLSKQTMSTLVDYIRTQRSLAQQEILDRVEKLIRDNAKDVLLIDGYMATVITIPHCRELLSNLKDTTI